MRKNNLLLILLIFTTICFAQQKVELIKLDGNWNYIIDPQRMGEEEKWFELTDFNSLEKIKVPSFFESTLGREYDGLIWYFKKFTIPKVKEKMAIVFEGVDDNAQVWLNGEYVGKHSGYSEKFFFDISKQLRIGENVLVVNVEDNGGPGGIYKDVFLKEYESIEEILKSKFADLTARKSQEWIKSAVIYELYPRAFTNEGTFAEATQRLIQLKELGVTILWLMPINTIGELNRKGKLGSPYSIKDYYGINPEYGNEDDLKELIKQAHRLGMKVILDVVLNHSSWDNKLIFEHPDWYTKNSAGEIIPPNPDWYDVADFNYDNNKLRKYMIDMMKFWVKKFDVDGFRCDVAENVPLDFWEELRRELDKIKPIFMLSEGTLPEHHLKAFDMTYSWNIYDILEDLVKGRVDPSVVIDILNKEKFTFPKNSLRMRFNENHDKRRATKVFGIDGAFITSALINTIPGVPLFYNGQEIGDSIYPSLFEKYSIPWKSRNDTNQFYDYYKRINKLRKKNLSLAFGDFNPVIIEDRVLAFTRSYGGYNILSIFNFSKDTKVIHLNKIVEAEGGVEFNFETSVGRKYRVNIERMGRPADTTIELEQLGFLVIEYTKSE